MTMTYQQQFVLDGLAGGRPSSTWTPDTIGCTRWVTWPAGSRRSATRGRHTHVQASRSPICAMPSTGVTANGWSPSTTRSLLTVSTPRSSVSHCCSATTNFRPPAPLPDRLIYERGGWYFTSRELEWDLVPRESTLPV